MPAPWMPPSTASSSGANASGSPPAASLTPLSTWRAAPPGGGPPPAAAGTLDAALGGLKQRGERFRLTARSLANTFIDVEGRTLGGRAILRLRDVTGDRAPLLRAPRARAAAPAHT